MKLVKKIILTGFALAFFGASIPEVVAQVHRPVIKRRVVKRAVATRRPAAPLYTVATGKRIRVRMNETINSKTARVGDTFTASVTEPVYSSNGVVVIPVGAEMVGRIDSVVRAQKGGKVGSIDASFTRLNLPNGTQRAINGSLTDLESDDARSDAEGTASGDKMKHRKLIFIGGGGAGGAVLGGAIGGGKGALIGGLLGAAGGFLGDRLTKGENVEVRSGTEFAVYLNRSIALPRFDEVTQ